MEKLFDGWQTVHPSPNTYPYDASVLPCSDAYVAFKPALAKGKHTWCVALENTTTGDIPRPSNGSVLLQPQPLLVGVTKLTSDGNIASPHTFCFTATDNGGKASSAAVPGYGTLEVALTCPVGKSANAAAAETGLPFPCALLLLFHLDADQGRMWVSACLPGKESMRNVEVSACKGASLKGVCPAIQPVFHAKLHVMLFD